MWTNNGYPPPIVIPKTEKKLDVLDCVCWFSWLNCRYNIILNIKDFSNYFCSACSSLLDVIDEQSLFPGPYLKGSTPQPAIAVKILGPKSRAGLIGKPQLYPYDSPIDIIRWPIIKGKIFFDGELFLSSVSAPTTQRRIAVPTNWIKNKNCYDQVSCSTRWRVYCTEPDIL